MDRRTAEIQSQSSASRHSAEHLALLPGRRPLITRSVVAAAVIVAVFSAVGVTIASLRPEPVVSVIVERKDTSVELFIGLPAKGLVDILAMDAHHLTETDGTVDFASLREGTWGIADVAFASVGTRLGKEAVTFEAMSLMVHPNDRPLPFSDPIQGLLAVSVCGVVPPETPPTLDVLHAYAGFIAYSNETGRPLRLAFAKTGRAAVRVETRDYENGRLVGQFRQELVDGGVLTIGGGR